MFVVNAQQQEQEQPQESVQPSNAIAEEPSQQPQLHRSSASPEDAQEKEQQEEVNLRDTATEDPSDVKQILKNEIYIKFKSKLYFIILFFV